MEWSGEVGIIRYSKKIRPVASDLSGGVAMVRGKLLGIFERVTWLAIGLIDHRYSPPSTCRRVSGLACQLDSEAILREPDLQLFRRDSVRPKATSAPVQRFSDRMHRLASAL